MGPLSQPRRFPWALFTHSIPCAHLDSNHQFMWQDLRGHWHALVHLMFDPAGRGPVPSPGWPGGHMFSRDGLVWSRIQECYSTNITLVTGEVFVTSRRKRPKLIFDPKTGVPTHLTNGAITHEGTYTVIAPLDV